MARTSRKGGARQVAAVTAERIWNVAVYARLSLEDSGRKGADTIETQIDLVTTYVTGCTHLSLKETYIDNGESGKDFDRPAWIRLMDDIRAGYVDCVCVKDLSRFSRNYIETIEFLEKIFPFMGVRFVSVNDGYDSAVSTGGNEGLIVALKSLINDQYLRDISRKICTSVQAKRERGEYTRGFAPYGYKKMDGSKGKLEPNHETAPAIMQIFEWRASGMSHVAICKRLDELGIPTPNEYIRRKKGDIYNSDFFKSTIWREHTLKGILRNPVYIGILEQGKQNQRLYEHKPCTDVPRDKWVITENAHEPIVSRELWEAVQEAETTARNAYPKSATRPERPENVLKSYVVCGVCGSKMSRQYSKKVLVSGKIWEAYYYLCPIHRQHPQEQSFRTIRADVLCDTVLRLVVDKLKSAANLAEIIEKRAKKQDNPRAVIDAEISRTAREIGVISDRLAGLYENYADEILTEQEYVRIKTEYENRSGSLRQRMDELSRRASTLSDVSASNNRWLKAVKAFQNPTELTREMIEAIIERINVFSPDCVEVVWKFKDEFDLLTICASEEGVA